MIPQNQGVGFGTRDLGKIPNMMKIIVGEVVVPEDEKSEKPPKEELKKKEYGELIDATIRLASEEGIVIPDHRYEEM